MSQATRSKVRAVERHRRAVARELIDCGCAVRHGAYQPAWDGAGDRPSREPYLETFDVHAAKEHARSLIAISDKDRKSTAISELDMYSGRLGQRILDALEGQPSECQAVPWTNHGRGAYLNPLGVHLRVGDGEEPILCPDCHGTGHNLRGKLPKVEWSPAVRRKVMDSERARGEVNQQRDSWTFAILDSLPADSVLFTRWNHARQRATCIGARERTVPRGDHRTIGGAGSRDSIQMRAAVAFLFNVRLPTPDASRYDTHVRAWRSWKLPAWRLGEIEQARQRGNAA